MNGVISMQELISIVVYWIIVPVIILSLFIFASTIAARAPKPESKTSAKAGLWAGLILFIVYVISQIDSLKEPNFTVIGMAGIKFWPVVYGTIFGFLLLLGVRLLLSTRQVGFIVLILAAASTCSLYSYIFIADIRNTVLALTLGAGLGALFHVVILPTSVKELF